MSIRLTLLALPMLVMLGLSARAQQQLGVAELPIPQCFGVAVHFRDGEVAEQVAYLKRAGFGWVRIDMFWTDVERSKEVYEFQRYDQIINALQSAGIRTIAILDYGNSLYDGGEPPASPVAREAFARFAQAAAKHYFGRNIVWEIYNEPNIDVFWKPRPDPVSYVALADKATAAIRSVSRDAIVGPALNGPIRESKFGPWNSRIHDFMDHVLSSEAARSWNAITIHPYRPDKAVPEALHEQVEVVRRIMRDHGMDPAVKPVISGEFGYSSAINQYDEATQAAFAVRTLLWAGIEHMPLSIWYDFQDDGPDDSEKEDRFGLLRFGTLRGKADARILKPAFSAIEQTSQLLRDYHFDSLVEYSDALIVARYLKGDRPAYAVWTIDNKPRRVTVTVPDGRWKSSRILADTIVLTAARRQGVVVDANAMPTIVYMVD
jgi:polysaccharide biosynthesis protein PslG